MMIRLLFVVVVLSFAAGEASACVFDLYCGLGSKCVKNGDYSGYCVGGMNPVNMDDDHPTPPRHRPSPETGNTCGSSLDCGIGGECLKSRGSLLGACTR